jgi:hypothetical protein
MILFEHKLSAVLLNESATADGIIYSINKQRELQHLNPVKPNNIIDIAAKIQTKQMIVTGEFGHILKGTKYPRLADRMQATGYNYVSAGEVLYSGTDNSEIAVQAWMGSKPHREALLHPDVEEIGTSVEYSTNGRPYICVVLCIPTNTDASDFGDEILKTIKKYGKTAGKKLLIKAAQSDQMKNIIKSPVIQKIIATLK